MRACAGAFQPAFEKLKEAEAICNKMVKKVGALTYMQMSTHHLTRSHVSPLTLHTLMSFVYPLIDEYGVHGV